MTATMQDTIERTIVLPVSRDRVWAAVTTPQQISQWFQHRWEFDLAPGAPIHFDFGEWGIHRGRVETVEPKDRVVYRWTHGEDADRSIPIEQVPSTLMEFRLENEGDGTRLTVVESGFANLPAELRDDALRNNTQGWDEQMGNIQKFFETA
jgi:uncharacterized protein YndB with AHSA1/START domain